MLTILNHNEDISDVDALITDTLSKIKEIEEKFLRSENEESADAIRYLLMHPTPKNTKLVKKLLSGK